MTPEALRSRTADFATQIALFTRPLLEQLATRHAASQLLRAATSVAANYRAVCRARSRAEFSAKLCIVLEEADETQYWLEFLTDSGFAVPSELRPLLKEAGEIVAIFTASRQTVRRRRRQGN
jgi:four helix bundle protein